MFKGLPQNARVALLGTVAAVGAFFVFGGGRCSKSSGSGDPLGAAPRDSFLVATVNVAELRRSPLYDILFGKDPGGAPSMPSAPPLLSPRALGIAKLSDACGFDPLSRVEALALAVPEEGDKGELGVAARVNVTGDELTRCTTALADKRGAKVETKEIGNFAVVEDPSGDGSAARPRLAYGNGGLLVVGRGAWFDAMLAASDHKAPSAREAPAHAAMRASLTGQDGWGAPTLVATALLPRSLRDRIKTEMGAELGAKDNSQNIMAGVLGVSTVGVALKAGGSGQSLDVAAELVCDKADGTDGVEACALVEKLILKKRLDWSKEIGLRMVGLGPFLDSVQVKQDGARLRVTAGAPANALASAIDRVLRFQARKPSNDDRPSDRHDAPPPAGRAPDEVVPAPRPSASAATTPPSARP